MSRSVFFWNSGGTVDGNILPERKAQKRCFMFGDFLCSKFRTGGFHMKQITGNKLLVKALKEEGVEYLFGYPGACTIDISDELYKQDEIKIVLPRHEQALVHEADAYARTTGKVGVCLVTSGPGATNLVTGPSIAAQSEIRTPSNPISSRRMPRISFLFPVAGTPFTVLKEVITIAAPASMPAL